MANTWCSLICVLIAWARRWECHWLNTRSWVDYYSDASTCQGFKNARNCISIVLACLLASMKFRGRFGTAIVILHACIDGAKILRYFRNGLLQKRKPVQGASSVNTLPAKSCQPWLIIIKLLGWRLCLAALVYGEFRCEYQPGSIGRFGRKVWDVHSGSDQRLEYHKTIMKYY